MEQGAESGRGIAGGEKTNRSPNSNGAGLTIYAPYLGEITLPVLVEPERTRPVPEQVAPQGLTLPVYGNYCGVGHGDPTGNTPPVDAVDAACREHDLCYANLGDFDQRCDQRFVESLPNAIANTPTPAGKNAGLLALLYFSVAERNLALGKTLFGGHDAVAELASVALQQLGNAPSARGKRRE